MNGDSAGADISEVLVICGPTAAGKSRVAMWLAREHGERTTTIISADSRQIYRRFDIGTAKPTPDERARVVHRGVDIAEPRERYSAAAWAAEADGWIAEARRGGPEGHHIPLIVGGTGLYLRALFEGLFHEPPLDVARRRALEPELATMAIDELRRWAAALDPARAHLGRTQLLRAIEIALLSGHRMSDLHRTRVQSPRWRPRYLVVDPGPVLAEWIGSRIDEMLAHGWPDEVRRLMQTVPADAPAWNSTGYDAIRRMVRGALTPAAAREAVVIATRQYAKRQRTWLRHQLPRDRVTYVDPSAPDWRQTVTAWAALTTRASSGHETTA